MRSPAFNNPGMFSYVSVVEHASSDHPIRKLPVFVDSILGGLDELLTASCALEGQRTQPRPSSVPESSASRCLWGQFAAVEHATVH